MFKILAADFIPVMKEAIENNCDIAFIKGQGVYFISDKGEIDIETKQRKHIAYAQGCNPLTDQNWSENADLLAGGEGERKALLSTDDLMLQHVFQTESDFEVVADQYSFFIISE